MSEAVLVLVIELLDFDMNSRKLNFTCEMFHLTLSLFGIIIANCFWRYPSQHLIAFDIFQQ